MRPTNDPRLIEIAKTFHSLEPFPDPEEFGELIRTHDGKFRHYSILPGGKTLGARFFIKGKNRFVAYAVIKRQLDLLRFADMVTVRLFKYTSRSRHRKVDDSDLNFPLSLVERDLQDFETDRPDIIAMLDAIEQHFLEIGLIRDQSVPLDPALDPRKKNRKTARSEFLLCHKAQMATAEQRHQELLDLLGGRLTEIEKRLDAIESRLTPRIEDGGMQITLPGTTTCVLGGMQPKMGETVRSDFLPAPNTPNA